MSEKVEVDHEFSTLMPPLSDEQLAGLEAKLREEGCWQELVTWNGILLDGHHRKGICERLRIPYRTREIVLADRLDAIIWIRANQRDRRNLSADQNAVNAEALAELLSRRERRDRARAAVDARERKAGRKPILLADAANKIDPPKDGTRHRLAQQHRTSERKMRQAREVRLARPDLLKKVAGGESSLAEAVRDIRREEARKKLAEVAAREVTQPTGLYDVIVVDPPWPMQKIERDCRERQVEFGYPTMDEEQLKGLSLPAADDCHVWLWTTHRFLPMALRLIAAWGLNYVCTFVWHKPGGFQPIGLPQYNCEFALYARKGSPEFLDTKAFPTCFEAPRGSHSEKPEEFYALLRRVTGGRRLDMFNRRAIEGFDGWGKEAAA